MDWCSRKILLLLLLLLLLYYIFVFEATNNAADFEIEVACEIQINVDIGTHSS